MGNWQRWVRHPQALWVRRALFQVHLWTGIAIGLYVLVISLTGSVLVYRSELRQIFNPQPRIVTQGENRMSPEALTDVAQRAYPDDTVSIFVDPDDPTHAVTISVNRSGVVSQMYFDPYTGGDLGHALPWGWRLTTWLLDLHDNILAGGTGRVFNTLGAASVMLLGFTGGIIWWPGLQSWRRSLTVDFRANWKRLTWSLHGALGFWTLAFVLMWGATGIYLSYPQPFTDLVNYLEPFEMETFEPRVGDAVLYWFTALHFGRFGGWLTKLLWAVVGLVPPAMVITGFLMWWNRVVRPQASSRESSAA